MTMSHFTPAPHIHAGCGLDCPHPSPPAGACATQKRMSAISAAPRRESDHARLHALRMLAEDLQAEANRLDDERGDEYDVYSEAMADTLATVAEAIRAVLHPRADLSSSAARQTYIETGVWPTVDEVHELDRNA